MDNLRSLQKKLAEIEAQTTTGDEDFPGQLADYRRRCVVDAAVAAADELILEGSDGSVEETDFITSAVAMQLVNKVHIAMQGKLLRKLVNDQINSARLPEAAQEDRQVDVG